MHEMAIAQSVIELVEDVADQENADAIKSIDVEIGALSGVVLEALEFAMEISVKNTRLETAKVNYLRINGIARCEICNFRFETDELLALCPECDAASYKIIDGKQLRIKSIVI